MVPQTQAALPDAQTRVVAGPQRATSKRWPLFLSVFGALAVSLLLWAGILWVVSSVISLING